MTKRDELHEKLLRDLASLKLSRIADIYHEVLDKAACEKGIAVRTCCSKSWHPAMKVARSC